MSRNLIAVCRWIEARRSFLQALELFCGTLVQGDIRVDIEGRVHVALSVSRLTFAQSRLAPGVMSPPIAASCSLKR